MRRQEFSTIALLALATIIAGCTHANSTLNQPTTDRVERNAITDTAPTWQWYTLTYQCAYEPLAVGHDGDFYFFGPGFTGGTSIVRTDVFGQQASFPISGHAPQGVRSTITANPDGNVYAIEEMQDEFHYDLVQVTPEGGVTEFPLPLPSGDVVTWMTTGSDGNLWVLGTFVGRVTTSGQYTSFEGGPYNSVSNLVRGPDKNLWFLCLGCSDRLVRIDVLDGSQEGFPIPADARSLVQGPDGNLYAFGISSSGMYKISTDGSWVEYPMRKTPSYDYTILAKGPNHRLYWAYNHRLFTWDIRSQKEQSFAAPANFGLGISPIATGVDGRLWIFESDALAATLQ